jgi:hypothetical protein
MTEKTVLMSFRVPPELKLAFELATSANDETSSQAIRKMMRAYVQTAGHAALMRQIAQKAQGPENDL